MIWQNPFAWIGLLALAIPLLVHLLGRRSARVQPFPTLRFLDASVLFVRRQRRITDVPLLLVRLGIIGLAVAALAQPLWLSEARERSLERLLARAIVLDTGANAARAEAQRLASEAQSALVIETAAPADELAGAAQWLQQKQGRAEVVVLSDFRPGVLEQQDLQALPPTVGLRLRRQPSRTPRPSEPSALPQLLGAGRRGQAALEAARALAPENGQLGAVSVVYSAEPRRAQLLGAARPVSQRWRDLVVQLDGDSTIERLHSDAEGRLLVFTRAEPGSLASAELLLGLMRAGSSGSDAGQAAPVPDSVLARWERPAGSAAGNTNASDGRWLWLAALLLLAVETVMRRRPRAA